MLTVLLFACWILRTQCLEVTNTSSCINTCHGPSLTFPSDVSCSDDEYSNTAAGALFQNCLECEITSTAYNGDTSTPHSSDLYWAMFNMKYTAQQCLFQSNGSTPNLLQCETVCTELYTALQASWFTTPPPAQYAYCSIDNNAFTTHATTCASCFQSYENSVVLGNFLNALQSACDTQPDAASGGTIALQRELFNTATVGTPTSSATTSSKTSSTTGSSSATDPGATDSASTTTTAPTSTSTGSATSSSESSSVTSLIPTSTITAPAVQQTSASSSPGISTGAAAGIGIGCGLGALALAAGLGWFFLKRRRQPQFPPAPDYYPYQDSKSAFSSVSPYQEVPPYAQQLASREVHEMDTRHSRAFRNELDGRPVH